MALNSPRQEKAHEIAELARSIGLQEDDAIIVRAKEIWKEEQEKGIYLGTYYITGYDICYECCGKLDGITKSGVKATTGRTVAAPSEFAFGTKLFIEGIGTRIVEDRGKKIKGKRLDVLCNNHVECNAITGYYEVFLIQE